MKKAAWFGALFSLGSLLPACTQAQNDCNRNPELPCFTGNGGTGGTTMVGGGGTGGAPPCAVALDCMGEPPTCKKWECLSKTCVPMDKCGLLTCDPGTNNCTGCKEDSDCPDYDQNECEGVSCIDTRCNNKKLHGVACTGGTCAQGICKKHYGIGCESPNECLYENCVDEVCCDTPCDGLCQACNQIQSVGTCTALAIGTLDGACGDTSDGCGETPGYCRCDDGVKNGDETDVDCGGPTCAKCGVGHSCVDATSCISTYCVDGYCCGATCTNPCRACNLPGLEGLCSSVDPGTKDACGGTQVCGVTACAEPNGACSLPSDCASNNCSAQSLCSLDCVMDTDCPDGQVCTKGACFDKATQGKPCLSANACQDGLTCVDGVCCDTACDGLCMGCAANYTAQPSGTCAPIQKGYDPHNECPQPDPAQPGPGGSAYCSGAPADAAGNSSCALPSP